MTTTGGIGPLFTDLYELTMAASFFDHRIAADASFSLFIRGYPPERNYFVAAGLEDALTELASLHFAESDLAYLKTTGLFHDEFLSFLRTFRFSGTVRAMPEGTVFFANEPMLEVSAPLIEAQIIETFLLNTLGFQTLIAAKAARCIHAAQGRPLIDFSLRRTQGQDAGLKVARCTHLAGFSATSNVLAGKRYGLPVAGTMAHSFIAAFENERDAFAAYARTFPDNAVFLIDTYDTLAGARHAAAVACEMQRRGHRLVGVRLDSGDMAVLSREVRHILDAAGLPEVKIFASSGFDETKIAEVLAAGGRIDAFGVGTQIGVSADAPFVDIVYKMVRFGDRNVRKVSPGKITLAGEKQVYRRRDAAGRFVGDVIGVRDEAPAPGEPLLATVMEGGRLLRPHPPLEEIRRRFQQNFADLPDAHKALKGPLPYPVEISPRLRELQERL